MNPIPYGRQNISLDDIEAIVATLKSDFLTQGPKIMEFEQAFAEYVGSQYAVAVSNGTAALHLSALALEVDSNSNVITTPITFAATANCILYCDGNISFADINPDTFLIDYDKTRALLEKYPKGHFSGLIVVDLAGRPVDTEKFRKLADEFDCWIIEDACHAPGGYYIDSHGNQQNCGNCEYTDLAIFSFHPVKHIACGEGGMITTNNKELYEKLLRLRTHGITKDPNVLEKNDGGWYYEMHELGFNYRLTDLQASLGLSQLKNAKKGLDRRRQIATLYKLGFMNNPNILNQSGAIEGHAYHLYIIETLRRKELYDYLRENQVYAQVHYIPIHTLPYYRKMNLQNEDVSSAESYYSKCLSLPMFPTLSDDEVYYVIDLINNFFDT